MVCVGAAAYRRHNFLHAIIVSPPPTALSGESRQILAHLLVVTRAPNSTNVTWGPGTVHSVLQPRQSILAMTNFLALCFARPTRRARSRRRATGGGESISAATGPAFLLCVVVAVGRLDDILQHHCIAPTTPVFLDCLRQLLTRRTRTRASQPGLYP